MQTYVTSFKISNSYERMGTWNGKVFVVVCWWYQKANM